MRPPYLTDSQTSLTVAWYGLAADPSFGVSNNRGYLERATLAPISLSKTL